MEHSSAVMTTGPKHHTPTHTRAQGRVEVEMLSLDDVYCHPLPSIDPRRAARLQERISYLFRHFDRTSPEVKAVTSELRTIFFDAVKCDPQDADLAKVAGFLPTGPAFDIEPGKRIAPSPDDTRIALFIGKPVAKRNDDGTWEMVLEKRYVVALRVVGRRTVHMTKVIPALKRTRHRHAAGRPLDRATLEEGRATQPAGSCCTGVSEVGKDLMDDVVKYTKAQVDGVVEELTARYASLLSGFTSTLEEAPSSSHFTLEVTRMHSRAEEVKVAPGDLPVAALLPTRCDTEFVETTVAVMKRALGEEPGPVGIPPKTARGEQPDPIATPPKIARG